MTEKKTPDWERIEADYRAGVLSLREIAGANPGINHVAIARRAKKEGWTRDLSAKIQAKADELVTREAVTDAVTANSSVSERQIIEANAARIAQVRGEHRADISRMRKLVLDLLAELEAVTGNVGLFEELGEFLRGDGESADTKRAEVYSRAISMASRIDGLKKLADAMKTLIALEREAYGLETTSEGAVIKIEGIRRTIIDSSK